jgi:hypothetical protein
MSKNKNPLQARMITTAEGQFVNVGDFKNALANEAFIVECAALIKVAKDQGLSPIMGVRLCIANALNEVTGVNAALMKKAEPSPQEARLRIAKIVIEDKGKEPPANGEKKP